MMIRTYSELKTLPTFEGRYQYLRLNGIVGKDTFGFDRYLNQMIYKSGRWRSIRDEIIVRDNGCDLGIIGYGIAGRLYIHHMNPITEDDILRQSEFLFNPEYLILTSFDTHNAIHYGDASLLIKAPIERKKNDTCPWRCQKK